MLECAQEVAQDSHALRCQMGGPACPYALSHIFKLQNVLITLSLPLTEKSCQMAAHPAPSRSRAGRWCMAKAWKRNQKASCWHHTLTT